MKDQLKLYFIMGSINGKNILEILDAALAGGITCFQFREKEPHALQSENKFRLAKSCFALCKQYSVPFIVNDDVELALALNADGVHVGQEDDAAEFVRAKLGPDKILGISVHTVEQANRALAAGANYVGVGPVYSTTTKVDARPPIGTRAITIINESYPELPMVGIGGITEQNFQPVIEAGASGIAVISEIAMSEQPYETSCRLARAITEVQKGRSI